MVDEVVKRVWRYVERRGLGIPYVVVEAAVRRLYSVVEGRVSDPMAIDWESKIELLLDHRDGDGWDVEGWVRDVLSQPVEGERDLPVAPVDGVDSDALYDEALRELRDAAEGLGYVLVKREDYERMLRPMERIEGLRRRVEELRRENRVLRARLEAVERRDRARLMVRRGEDGVLDLRTPMDLAREADRRAEEGDIIGLAIRDALAKCEEEGRRLRAGCREAAALAGRAAGLAGVPENV